MSAQFRFETAREAIAAIVEIGILAEAHGHHPNLSWVYNRIDIELWTHDEGGLTELDTKLAHAIENALRKRTSSDS